jgi:hypothetical protein
MHVKKAFVLIIMIVSFGLLVGIAAKADAATQQTSITFSNAVQIPGQVLPAGTYMFRLAESTSDLNTVQIFNAEGTKLYATLRTISTDRMTPAQDTTVTLADQQDGHEALISWFYPGESIGHQFVYPKRVSQDLARETKHIFVGDKEVGTSANGDTAVGD